ncbi:hypothetical protein FHX42_001146 [Saccharopolyspora lacisalsi]|uniref:DUF4192 domain-containing protein n=1 Tax=Halosaccharopolyspora lacisalsi TaxID=1000566 RepID=A0A839DWJ0_9PSEU|nr:DUF4192 domain-containing protein [Halosaccharopolyspora lacisalsi]MBA8823817.1 hypothetical protein [Halosaccharopolyspora lacisalsi]
MSVISLKTAGDFVAAIPHLLGFHPYRSLVVAALGEDERIGAVLRADLDDGDHGGMVADLLRMLDRSRPNALLIALIDDRIRDLTHPPRRPAALGDVMRHAETLRIGVRGVVWASATSAGATWCTTDNHGHVPDPRSTTLAATMALRGHVTHASREELAALLNPPDPDTLARRAATLRHPVSLPPDGAAMRHVRGAVQRSHEGTMPETEAEILVLARALTDPNGRDTGLVLTADAPGRARELWLMLTRAVPEPHRAYPAALLSVAAYLDGDGALAEIALTAALEADPEHSLAELLRQALHAGIGPAELARGLRDSVRQLGIDYHGQE